MRYEITTATGPWEFAVMAVNAGHSTIAEGWTRKDPSNDMTWNWTGDEKGPIYVATHSFGERFFIPNRWAEPGSIALIEDDQFSGEWVLVTPENIGFIKLTSSTSKSFVEVRSLGSGIFEVTLGLPVNADGVVYRGHYAECFEKACQVGKE